MSFAGGFCVYPEALALAITEELVEPFRRHHGVVIEALVIHPEARLDEQRASVLHEMAEIVERGSFCQ